MAHPQYRLTLELSVPEAITADRIVRLLREIPVPGTAICWTVSPIPAPSVRREPGTGVPAAAGTGLRRTLARAEVSR
jgi:hypothetical protein